MFSTRFPVTPTLAVFAACASAALSVAAGTMPAVQAYVWRQIRIGGGGFVTGVVFHPAERDLIYARTDVGGAYRSNPQERRWVPLNDMLDSGSNSLSGVLSLAVDPNDTGAVYLACGQYTQAWEKNTAAILWSADRGATWKRASLPFKLGGNEDGRSTGERLQVDPHDGGILFLGTNHDGLWTSVGRNPSVWNRVKGFPAASVTFVWLDRRGDRQGGPASTLYAGSASAGAGLFRSRDGGRTWSAVPGQPAGLIPHHASQDASGTLFISYANRLGPNGATDGGVWKLDPADDHWTDITPVRPAGEDKFGYAGVAIDPRNMGTVLVTTLDRWNKGDEVFRTTNGGKTWTPLLQNAEWDHASAPYTARMKPHWIGCLSLDPFNPDHAIFVTGYGVWACEDLTAADSGRATRWDFQDAGLEEIVAAAVISPPAGAPLISALFDVGTFRHDDLAVSPPVDPAQSWPGSCPSIDFAEARPEIVVRTQSGGAARASISRDGGASWTPFGSAPSTAAANGPGAIAVSSDGSNLVWLPGGSAAYCSNDGGASWVRSRGSPVSTHDYRTMAPTADRENPARFYIYDFVSGEVFASADGGASFSVAASGLPTDGGTLRAMPGREGCLWLPTARGLFRSLDAGRTFEPVAGVQGGFQVGFGKAAPGRDQPSVFLAGEADGVRGILRSDDAGRTWLEISDASHQYGMIRSLTGDPRVYARVYLGTDGRGLVCGEPDR